MKILHFFSENFKRIKVVEFSPDNNMVLISGKNGQGKSSVLDAIWSTLQYKATKAQNPTPVRHGEDTATNIIELDDYVVQRTYSSDGESRLKIETKDGKIVKSPQALLDGLISTLSFDPLQFANAKNNVRREMIETVFGINLAEFDAKDATLKEARRDKKRELDMIASQLSGISPPSSTDPVKEVSANDLIKELTQLQSNKRKALELSLKIDTLTEQLRIAKEAYSELQIPNDSDISTLQSKIANVESLNARAREVQKYLTARDRKDAIADELEILKKKIELNNIEKAEAIEEADLPIDDLVIDETGITVKGVIFDQLSQAEKIQYSMAIAMAANPDLRVMRIVDGSLLDAESLKAVESMAKDNDYQIWIELVRDDDKIGVVIEDGSVKNIN